MLRERERQRDRERERETERQRDRERVGPGFLPGPRPASPEYLLELHLLSPWSISNIFLDLTVYSVNDAIIIVYNASNSH